MSNREQIVCLGSYGDLCIVLPFALDRFRATGEKTSIVVAQNYEDILDGVSYVTPIVYPETWKRGQDGDTVHRAVSWIKEQSNGSMIRWVNPVESAGTRKPVGESFVHEIWANLGRPNDWRRLPLEFDRRDVLREAALVEKHLNVDLQIILVALSGVASPFPEKDDLIQAVQEALPKCRALDLSEVRAEKPYDLIRLMDRAELLIAGDSLPLHLSAASKVPVIALSRDLPTPWNGTPWQKRFELHCRYSQYSARKPEILHMARQVLSGVRRPSQRPIMGLEAHGYNPSLIQWNGNLWSTYRHHPHGSWKTQLAIVQLDPATATAIRHLPLRMPSDLSTSSVEDMRLWTRDDRLFGSFVVAGVAGNRFRCVMAYGEIKVSDSGAELAEFCRPEYGHNDGSALEKNWVFFDLEGRTHFIYACSPEHVVVRIRDGKPDEEWRTPSLSWAWGQIRGGTPPIPYRGKWLRFFHSQIPISDKPRDVRYYMGAYVMNSEPPFEMLAVSSHPILSGHEWRSGAAHWKPNVVIPYGAVAQDDGWMVSVGVNDTAACLVKVTESHLNFNDQIRRVAD